MLKLPSEVLLNLLLRLDPFSLEAARCTCKRLAHLIDESVWRESFFARYSIASSGTIPRIHATWRGESIQRARVLKSYETQHGTIETIDWDIEERRTVHYDAHRHRFLIAELGEGFALVIDCFTGRRFEWDELMIRLRQGKSMSNKRYVKAFEEGFVYALDGELELVNVDDSFTEWKTQTFEQGPIGKPCAAALSNDCLVVISCSMGESEIKVWDTKTSKCLGSVIVSTDERLDVFTDGKRIVVQSQYPQDLNEPDNFFAVIDFSSLNIEDPPLVRSSTVERPRNKLGAQTRVDWPTQTITTADTGAVRSTRFDGSVFCWPATREELSAQVLSFGPHRPVRWAATINAIEELDVYDLDNIARPHISFDIQIGEIKEDEMFDREFIAMAMNKTIVAIGWYNGAVSLHDVLNGEPLRWLIPKDDCSYTDESIESDDEFAEAKYHKVESIHLHPFLAQGVVVYEYKAIAFSFNHEEKQSS